MDWKSLETYPNTWKWVLLICGSLFTMTILSSFPNISLDIGTILSGISLVALYGLAYEKPIWSLKFWRVFFWVFSVAAAFVVLVLVLTIVNSMKGSPEAISNSSGASGGRVLLAILALAIYAIQFRGVFLYAKRRERLWSGK